MHYFYVLQSESNKEKFYFGCTSDLRQRVRAHNTGESRATRKNGWRLVYYEAFLTLSGAREREYRVKHHGSAKRHLIERIAPTLE